MSRLRMGVVGVGALGQHHARLLSELESVKLIAVADPHAEQGQRVADDCCTKWTADFRDLFSQVDAVSIAVPTTAHLEIASEFITRRIPVLVEKPIACDVAESEQLVELAEEKNVILQVGHIERFNPAMITAKRFCGPPKYIRCERLSPFAFRSTDIGVIHDLMIHDIDLILDLVPSPVERADAFGLSLMSGRDDCVQARLEFQNGCVADLSASRVNPTAKREMQVWSDNGCVTVDFSSCLVTCYTPTEALQFGTPPVELAKQAGTNIELLKKAVFQTYIRIESPSVASANALFDELTSFVECVHNERQPIVDGQQALQAMKVAERILDSVNNHEWDGDRSGLIRPNAIYPASRRLAG